MRGATNGEGRNSGIAKEEKAEKMKAIAAEARLREERMTKKSWYNIW
jgi:hypothetical protein